MKRFSIVVTVLTLAGLLAACEVSVRPLLPDYDETVTAEPYEGQNLANAQILDEPQLGPGESILYRVQFAGTRRDAGYYIVEEPFELVLLDRFESAIASSSNADFFRSGLQGLDSAQADASVEPSGIGVALACPGPCVIEPLSVTPRYVRVINPTSFSATGAFRALHRDFEDTSEATSGPDPLNPAETTGALESLGDEDAYIVQADGDLTLSFGALASGLEYRAEIVIDGSDNIVFGVGETRFVESGDEVRVYAANGASRAAVAGKSRYRLDLQQVVTLD
jgi:hypothetical protein